MLSRNFDEQTGKTIIGKKHVKNHSKRWGGLRVWHFFRFLSLSLFFSFFFLSFLPYILFCFVCGFLGCLFCFILFCFVFLIFLSTYCSLFWVFYTWQPLFKISVLSNVKFILFRSSLNLLQWKTVCLFKKILS